MIRVRKAEDRGVGEHGWLHTRHTFSFSQYRDPDQVGFSDLLVINDDIVEPRQGFGTHPHRDMEIFTYVLEGALAHKDSMGTGSVIKPGEVQMMSAGSGITHSEFNAQDDTLVHLLQIWIIPNRLGVTPRYQQKTFAPSEKRGRLRLIISPNGEQESLSVYQDTRVYAGFFDGVEQQNFLLPPNRHAYVHVARGTLQLNGTPLKAGDGARVTDTTALRFSNGAQAEVLLFDLRPNELPER
jgi:hypothetical protein